MSKKRVAILDPTSSVLPYDESLARTQGCSVDLYCSITDYNYQFYDSWQYGCVYKRCISKTTKRSLFYRSLQYLLLMLDVYRKRRLYDAVFFSFPAILPIDALLIFFLGTKATFIVHNAVPHDSNSKFSITTALLLSLSRNIAVISKFTEAELQLRYSCFVRNKRISLLPIPLQKVAPHLCVPRATPKLDLCGDDNILVTFIGTVKRYKGVASLLSLIDTDLWQSSPYSLEILGKWDRDLSNLKSEFLARGVRIEDDYLTDSRLHEVLCEPRIFIMPYKSATQSGVMYTLLNYKARFICTNVGDLGEFMWSRGLEALIFDGDQPASVFGSLEYLLNNDADVIGILYGD